MTLYKWSQTANSNANSDSTINWAEGMPPSAVNDSSRAEMAAVAKYRDDNSGVLNTAGSSTAITITSNQVTTVLLDGFSITARITTTNGAAPTLNVDATGAKAIRVRTSTAVPTGAMLAGSMHKFTYDSADDCWYVACFFAVTTLAGGSLDIVGTTVLTAPAIDDLALLYDLSVTANRGITLANLFNVMNLFTEDTSPDETADFLLSYDTSAATVKKVKPSNLQLPATLPTVQEFLSASGTYTTPAGLRYAKIRMAGGGGGGAAAGANNGVAGTDSSFAGWVAKAGAGGIAGGAGGAGGTGGASGSGTVVARRAGGNGNCGGIGASATIGGASGGTNPFGGAGQLTGATGAGTAGKANTGAGGGGGSVTAANSSGGGGAGEYVEFYMSAAQLGVSQSYVVGPGGAGGAAGSQAGGNGAVGGITVEEFY